MSAILDRAKAHFAALPRKEIKIKEWGESKDKPAVITWTQLTVRDRERIYEVDPETGRSPSGGVTQLRAVIFKACDEHGNNLFDGMSEHDLRHNVDGDIVGRISNAILFDAGLTKKNGAAKPVATQVEDSKND